MAAEVEMFINGGFRCHLLIPHKAVGSLDEDKPTSPWIEKIGNVFLHEDDAILELKKSWPSGGELFVKVKAYRDIWIQEPGLSVKIAGNGAWQGFGPDGEWTKTTKGVKGWLPLTKKDAHKSTVHFSRSKTSKEYTVGVEFRWPDGRYRWRSDGGFLKPLNKPATPNAIPWQDCEVFNRGWYLTGVAEGFEVFRRWELAGHMPDRSWMHFLGWSGGAGCITNSKGHTPTPGASISPTGDGFDKLWQPRSWRKLAKGESISQSLTTIPVKGKLR